MEQKRSYRKAEAKDVDRIKEILFGSLSEYKIELPDNYSVADIDDIGSNSYPGIALVLLKKDVVNGFAILRPFGIDSIELKRFYLTASERKKGLGKRLLEYSLDCAKEANYRNVRLETTSRFIEAVAFYRKNGFSELQDAKTAPGHDLVFEKAI